ncbi:MAG: hypothetical protein M1829_000737 [Trizodia sp. TS-e1964]|nr:MAG: hypothetical protein M1829_000737 [Trizodia sp. TS-e1964]
MISFARRQYIPLVIAFLIFVLYLFQAGRISTNCADALGQTQACDPRQDSIIPQSRADVPDLFPGATKPIGSNYSRTLVIARMSSSNVDWIAESLPHMHAKIYAADDPNAVLHPPQNKGHEAMVYLTYLIDHYHALSDVTIFMHDHRHTWHNERLLGWDAVETLERLSSERVIRQGYMNIRCSWNPGCPAHLSPLSTTQDIYRQEQLSIAPAWRELFPGVPVPEVIAQPCCAQFAVSRERIQGVPLSQLEHYRTWLLNTPLTDYISGRVFEYLWQVIFTRQAVFCASVSACFCDGFGICLGGDGAYASYDELAAEEDEARQQLDEWDKKSRSLEAALEAGVTLPDEEMPQFGADILLKARIQALEAVAIVMKAVGVEKGMDPKVRAQSAGREWKEGDGF